MATKAASRKSRRRRNEYRRKILYAFAAAGLLVATVAASILLATLRPLTLRIAVTSASEDARIAEAVSRVLTRERSPVRLSVVAVEHGQVEALLNSGRADLATVRSDEMSNHLLAIAILRKSTLFVWTTHMESRKAARALEWKDVSGSKIAMLEGSPADVALLNVVLTAEGIPLNKVEIVPKSGMDAMAGDRSINIFAAVGAMKSKAIAEGFRSFARIRETPSFLGVETAEAIILRQPKIEVVEVPKAAFASGPAMPQEAVSTIAISDLIVGSQAISEQNAAAFARQLFAHRQAILREIPDNIGSIEKPNTDKDSAIPAHPGVAAYIDGTERTFLERYGDYFWGVILLLSALGSFGAGLRAFFHPDEQESVSALRDRVLDLAVSIRNSADDDLVQIEKEVHHIVRETLDKYEEGVIEEGALTALGMAIEQFRSAAASRNVSQRRPATKRTS